MRRSATSIRAAQQFELQTWRWSRGELKFEEIFRWKRPYKNKFHSCCVSGNFFPESLSLSSLSPLFDFFIFLTFFLFIFDKLSTVRDKLAFMGLCNKFLNNLQTFVSTQRETVTHGLVVDKFRVGSSIIFRRDRYILKHLVKSTGVNILRCDLR